MTELMVEIGQNKFKLSLGYSNDRSKLAIDEVSGRLEEFDIFLEIKSEDDVQRLKKIFQLEGGSVKKLSWYFYSKYKMAAADVIRMLNCFPKLEILELSSWRKKFTGDCCGKLILPNIKILSVTRSNKFIIDFLTNVLPENSIQDLRFGDIEDVEENLLKFITKQTSIKRLTICDDLMTVEPFTLLDLEYLHCAIHHDTSKIELQREFIHTLINLQPNLKSLEISDSDNMFSFVTNAMFADICALSSLEYLSINIESMKSDGIKAIQNLKALKTLEIKAAKERTTMWTLEEFSAIKNATIKNLTLNMWFEVSTKFYREIGHNFESLKSLTIEHESNHRFSLFAKAFPNLERLKIRFGDAKHPLKFQQIYDINDKITMHKLKTLMVYFGEEVETQILVKFMSSFPNLEKLKIDATLSFTADFITQTANNLNNIKSLKLLRFEIEDKVAFTPAVIEALKLLRSKLNYLSLYLTNTQNKSKRNSDHDYESRRDFSYKSLIDKLRRNFNLKESYFVHVCKYNNLFIEAGKSESWSDVY